MSALAKILFFTLTISSALSSSSCTKHRAPDGSHVVVRVNSDKLTAEDLSRLLANRLREFNPLMARDSNIVSVAKTAIVQDFIVNVVTAAWAKENQLFVRKEALDDAVATVRKSYPDDLSFRKTLATEGIVYDHWIERLRQSLLSQMVADELRKKITRPALDVIKNYYLSNKSSYQIPAAIKLRQIVLENRHQAELVLAELRRGKSFSELAKRYSIAPEGKSGGDLGWVERGGLPIFDTAFRLLPQQRSGVSESPYGFHILEVLDKRSARTLSFEEAKLKIEATLLAQVEQENYSRWLETRLLAAKVFKDEAVINAISVYTRGN